MTYSGKHNDANGERNRDGADDNQSWNCGVEGETDDPGVTALRDRQARNLLGTLFLSQGVPMLLAGDELGRTQRGNNNAYCQDNEISWVDWKLDDRRRALLELTKRLIRMRHQHAVLQRPRFLTGDYVWDSTAKDIAWLRPDGEEMTPEDWQRPWISSFAFALGGDALKTLDERGERLLDDGLLALVNAHHEPVTFRLPGERPGSWLLVFDTAQPDRATTAPVEARLRGGRARPRAAAPAAGGAGGGAAAAEAPGRAVKREAACAGGDAPGVLMPLFAIRGASGWGLGEIPDLARFAGWASRAGFSVVQLLPVNETAGLDASPYAASSAFALDPVYLSLDACEDFMAAGGRDALSSEDKALLAATVAAPRIDWGAVRRLKTAGIRLAFERFLRDEWRPQTPRARQLVSFARENQGWIEDHAVYRVFHDRYAKSWQDWPAGPRDRHPGDLAELREKEDAALVRVRWTQWQLDRQWRKARLEASRAGVELMGDLPFVVGADSADVWSRRWLFRPDLHVGTPPEEGTPEGQDWGLPLYNWDALARDRFGWIRERATRAGQLFALYRVDHAMGLYRTYFRSVDGKDQGFSPPDEHAQLRLGETLLRLMGQFGEVVAEDLGAVPSFLRPSLERVGVPGYRVLRWEKDGDEYRDPATWPECSVATNGTHDTETTAAWYDGLSPEEQRDAGRLFLGRSPTSPASFLAVREQALRRRRARSPAGTPRCSAWPTSPRAPPSTRLALVPFQDALGSKERVNTPGTNDGNNWTFRAPMTVDELLADEATIERLAKLAAETGRSRPK